MKKDICAQFLCKDCEDFGRCQYYHSRKEDSYICKYFHLPDKLDKIRERIELEKLGYPPSAGYCKAIIKCLQIIDKYKAEKEESHGRTN